MNDVLVPILLTMFVVGIVVVYLSSTAGRLDRLHRKRETLSASLDAALVRRAAETLDVATSGALDPISSAVLAEAANAARLADPDGTDLDARSLAESELTSALCAVFDDRANVEEICDVPEVAALVDQLGLACRRVVLARRFLNDTVRSVQMIHRHRVVRLFRLAGRTPTPLPVDFDDTVPGGLTLT